jgi:hypothetical protein
MSDTFPRRRIGCGWFAGNNGARSEAEKSEGGDPHERQQDSAGGRFTKTNLQRREWSRRSPAGRMEHNGSGIGMEE